ncbi:YkvA family protein [Priestia filamentosa]|uniref:YkvA family protein n=1 Tax=Priestia filamentosa TaxID=1402861 RepID=UPI00385727B8
MTDTEDFEHEENQKNYFKRIKDKILKKKTLNENEYEEVSKRYKQIAENIIKNKDKVQALLKEAMDKAKKNEGSLGEVFEKLQLLFELSFAWVKGEYKEIPKSSIITIFATILYFISPFDVIPDFITVLGFIDDVTVIGFAINKISEDLDKFKLWKETKGADGFGNSLD